MTKSELSKINDCLSIFDNHLDFFDGVFKTAPNGSFIKDAIVYQSWIIELKNILLTLQNDYYEKN